MRLCGRIAGLDARLAAARGDELLAMVGLGDVRQDGADALGFSLIIGVIFGLIASWIAVSFTSATAWAAVFLGIGVGAVMMALVLLFAGFVRQSNNKDDAPSDVTVVTGDASNEAS